MGLQLQLAAIDIVIIVVFLASVVALVLWKSRREEESSEDYFLAGRGLRWWLIGISLIAANISAEQFEGTSGSAAREDIGLAVASYEWIAAVTLVGVAFLFLPRFLRSGIYTIPEYLEYRFTHSARTLMSLLVVIIYVGVNLATVIYLGAKTLHPLLAGSVLGVPVNVLTLSWRLLAEHHRPFCVSHCQIMSYQPNSPIAMVAFPRHAEFRPIFLAQPIS